MANLSATLSDPQATGQPIVDNEPASSGASTIVDTLAKGLSVFQSHIYRQAEQARAQQAAARETIKFNQDQTDRATQDAVARASVGVNDQLANPAASVTTTEAAAPPPISADLQGSVDYATGKLNSYTTAANQGTLSPLAYQALTQQALHQVLAAHPEYNAGVVIDQFKKNGISLFDAYNTQKSDAESRQAAQQKAWSDNYSTGMNTIAPEVASTMTPDQIASAGQAHNANLAVVAAQKSAADLAAQNARLSQDTTTFNQGQDARNTFQAASAQFDSALNGGLGHILTQLTVSAPEGGVDPAFETRLAKDLPAARAYANTLIDKIVAASNPGSAQEASALRQQLTARADSIFQPLQQRPQETANAVKSITDRIGITSSQAFPLLTEMRRLGVNVTMLPNVMSAIPPSVLQGLNAEITSITKNPSMTPSLAQIHIDHVIGVLTGTQTLQNVSGPQARQVVTAAASNFTTANADAVAAGRGDKKMWLNGYGSVINAVGGINRQSGTDSLVSATRVIANSSSINAVNAALSDPSVGDQARITANGARAAAAQLASQLRQTAPANAKAEYYKVQWDTSNGRATLVPDTAGWKQAHPVSVGTAMSSIGSTGPGAPIRGTVPNQPPPSASLQQQVAALNSNVSFLGATSKWDPNEQKATPLQLRNHYGHNVDLPAGARKPQATNGRQSYEPLFDQLESTVQKTPEIMSAPVANITAAEGLGKDPNSNAVGGFIPSTWLSLIKTNRPDLAQGKSDSQLLAMRSDPTLNHQMVGFNARDNAQVLASHNIPATTGNLNLMHLYGPGEGPKVLAAAGNTPIENLVSDRTLNANPWMKGKTVDEIRSIRHAG